MKKRRAQSRRDELEVEQEEEESEPDMDESESDDDIDSPRRTVKGRSVAVAVDRTATTRAMMVGWSGPTTKTTDHRSLWSLKTSK